jgi:hypothetical protein
MQRFCKIISVPLFAALFAAIASAQSLVSDLTVQRTILAQGTISPSQLTADTNDWAPTNFSKVFTVRLSTDASRNLTGLAGGAAGRIVTLANVGTHDLVLKNASSSSTAANRFALSADYTLSGGSQVALLYDGTASRWMLLGYQPVSVIGTVTNTGGSLTANYLVLGAGSVDTKVVAGITSDGTSKIVLGVAGTSVGSIDFKNATSGTINLAPPTGALGTVSVVLPLGGTLATLAGSESLTNKKLGSLTSNGYVTTSGGDGTLSISSASGILDSIGSTRGQIIYRGASGWAVLSPGTSGQLLKTNGASADPSWFTTSASSPLTTKGDIWAFSTVDARLAVGTDGQALVADSSQTLGIKWATLGANPSGTIGLSAVNGSATTYMRSDAAPALSQGIAPTWTSVHTFTPQVVLTGGASFPGGGTITGSSGTVKLNAAASSNVLLVTSGTALTAVTNTSNSPTSTLPTAIFSTFGTTQAETGIAARMCNASASVAAELLLTHARGTLASPTATQSGDILGRIGFGGFSNTWQEFPSVIRGQASETWGSGANGTKIIFSTTLNGTTTRSDQFSIDNDGTVAALATTEATSSTAGSVVLSGGLALAKKLITASSIQTGAPSGGTAAAWKFGTVATVSPTAQNRTIELDVAGTRYFLTAKTTND